MIKVALLLFAAGMGAADAFAPLSYDLQQRFHARRGAAVVILPRAASIPPTPETIVDVDDDDSMLARLQHDYKALQERLLSDVVIKHDQEDAERVEEHMLEIATEAARVQEHKVMDIINHEDLQSKHKVEAAKILLGQLKRNESVLMTALEKLKEEKKALHEQEELHAQHRSFLNKVKDAIYAHPDLLASLDPHIL